jgi:hypothetical protein
MVDISNIDNLKFSFGRLVDIDFIFLTNEEKNIIGYVASSTIRTIPMKKNNIFQISSIYGPSYGELLYSAFSSCFGKITPSNNISDIAKKRWTDRYNNRNWNKFNVDGIGYYDEEDNESLNYVYDLNQDIKENYLNKITKCDNETMYKGQILCRNITNELYYNREKYYTFGKSQYRNNIKLII